MGAGGYFVKGTLEDVPVEVEGNAAGASVVFFEVEPKSLTVSPADPQACAGSSVIVSVGLENKEKPDDNCIAGAPFEGAVNMVPVEPP